jgi:hypothetical protein
MNKLQRYVFWIIGIGLIAHAIYQFILSFVLQYKNLNRDGFGASWLDWFGTLSWSFGYALQSLAIAMLCIFAARLCKLNEDPTFKEDFTKIIRKLRKAGEKK